MSTKIENISTADLSPYEFFQLERYGNILPEKTNPLESEDFENGADNADAYTQLQPQD